ncbi:MAG: FAD:protein FMN transferase [Propionibacteriaceae bacterium]|jgi:thiamine biosynthesis lipoprotein|nr:FAD:protein FMN transferase [Propionibacteriaceae bacterium]
MSPSAGPTPADSRWRGRFPALGTTVALDLTAPDAAGLAQRCQSLVEELEGRLSRFRPDSDVSRLNRSPGRWIEVSEPTDTVLRAALAGWRATEGAFTVALPQPVSPARPDPAAAGPGLTDGGDRRWRLDPDRRLDLGGIAKGHIADQALALCRATGASQALVDLGSSSLAVLGQRPSGGPWRVALRSPGGSRRQAFGWLEVTDQAVSTSGWDERGRHLIDPASGRMAQAGVEQVTTLADLGLTAEIWSTALMVLGPAGLFRLYRPAAGFEAVLVTTDSIITSPGLTGLNLNHLEAPKSVLPPLRSGPVLFGDPEKPKPGSFVEVSDS